VSSIEKTKVPTKLRVFPTRNLIRNQKKEEKTAGREAKGRTEGKSTAEENEEGNLEPGKFKGLSLP